MAAGPDGAVLQWLIYVSVRIARVTSPEADGGH